MSVNKSVIQEGEVSDTYEEDEHISPVERVWYVLNIENASRNWAIIQVNNIH